jgi:hypothetical protein
MLSPAINGTEQRLDVVLGELRGLRQDLGELLRVLTPVALSEPVEDVVELREPEPVAKPKPRARKK